MYGICVIDDVTGDILWFKFSSDMYSCAYLPSSESTRLNDPELFYSTLPEQVYTYQNEGRMFIRGDFNSEHSRTSMARTPLEPRKYV